MDSVTPKLSLYINNVDMLYSSYLPITSFGALFIQADTLVPLESEVLLQLHIDMPQSDVTIRKEILTSVCWINYSAVKNRPKGMGLRFVEKESAHINKSILAIIGDRLSSTQPTFMF